MNKTIGYLLLLLGSLSSGCNSTRTYELEVPAITGKLGFPIHTYHEISGFPQYGDRDNPEAVTRDLYVLFVDGRQLKNPIALDIEGIDEKGIKASYTLGGYETIEYSGIPKDVLKKSPSWQKKLNETETFFDPFEQRQVTQKKMHHSQTPYGDYLLVFKVTDIIEN